MPRLPSSFFLNAKNIFLTYPRCTVTKEQALDSLRQKQFPIPPIYIRVAAEQHQDGTPHLHCLLQFKGKFRTRNQRFFDISLFHPNVQGARNAAAVRDYISKYGDFTEWGAFQSDGRTRHAADHGDEVYAAALASDDKRIALDIIKKGDPRSFVIHYDRMSSNLDRIFLKPSDPYQSNFPNFQNVPQSLAQWAAENVRGPENRPHRPKSVIIEGPSRTGKTCWARSLNPQAHNYYAGHIDLAHHSDDAWYNVIDDVNPHFLKHWKEFIGAQHDWVSNCKYAKPRRVKGGIPSIVLCNPGPNSSYYDYLSAIDRSDLYNWTRGNAEFCFIDQSLFSETQVQEEEQQEEAD